MRHPPGQAHLALQAPLGDAAADGLQFRAVTDGEQPQLGPDLHQRPEHFEQKHHAVPGLEAADETQHRAVAQPQLRAQGAAALVFAEARQIHPVGQDVHRLLAAQDVADMLGHRGRHRHDRIRAAIGLHFRRARLALQPQPAKAPLLLDQRRVHLKQARHAQPPRHAHAGPMQQGVALVHQVRPEAGAGEMGQHARGEGAVIGQPRDLATQGQIGQRGQRQFQFDARRLQLGVGDAVFDAGDARRRRRIAAAERGAGQQHLMAEFGRGGDKFAHMHRGALVAEYRDAPVGIHVEDFHEVASTLVVSYAAAAGAA